MKWKMVTGITAVIFFMGLSGIASASLVDGLIGFYQFNGDATDSSVNGNDGVVNGATLTTDRFGNPDSAYLLDGINDYINLGNGSDFNIYDQITVSMWVKPTSFGDTTISKWKTESGWQGSWIMGIDIYGTPYFYVTGDGWNLNNAAISDTTLTLDTFTLLTGTYSRSDNTIRLYVNGIETGTGVGQSGSIFVSNAKIYIGASDYYVTSGHRYSYFDGTIDDVRIYNRALSSSEVKQLSTPIPGAIWLLGSGLIGLIGYRKRMS